MNLFKKWFGSSEPVTKADPLPPNSNQVVGAQDWGRGVPLDQWFQQLNAAQKRNYSTLITCANMLAKSIAQLGVIVKDNDKELFTGSIFNLFKYPNSIHTFSDFVNDIVYRWTFDGYAAYYIRKNIIGGIMSFDPIRVAVGYEPDHTYSYTYTDLITNQQVKCNIDNCKDIVYIRNPITVNADIGGCSVLRYLVQQAEYIDTTIKHATDEANGGVMNNAIISVGSDENLPITQDQSDTLRAQFMQRYARTTGSDTAIPMFLTNARVSQLKINPVDAQQLENMQFTESQIQKAFGLVDEIFTSALNADQYRVYMQQVIFPLCTAIESAFNKSLVRMSKLNIAFDYAKALQGDYESYSQVKLSEYEKGTISLAEYRKALGLPYLEQSENIFSVQANNVVLGDLQSIVLMTQEIFKQRQLAPVAPAQEQEQPQQTGGADDTTNDGDKGDQV